MIRAIGLLVLISIGMVFFTATSIVAQDWPQWRGPAGGSH